MGTRNDTRERDHCRICSKPSEFFFRIILTGDLSQDMENGDIGICRKCLYYLKSSNIKLWGTNAEKRRAIRECIKYHPNASNREIARQAGVSHVFVARLKREDTERATLRRPKKPAKKSPRRNAGS